MRNASYREKVKLWRQPALANIDLMRATYVTQSFPRHTHEGFGVGVIEQGALEFFYRGENVVALPGTINLVNPGEVHTGHAAVEDGWTYRMFYFSADVMQNISDQVSDRQGDMPFFKTGVIHDDRLALMIKSLHADLEEGSAPALEYQSRLLSVFAALVTRHAINPPVGHKTGNELESVRRAKEYMEGHYRDNISLEYLASIVNMSPFHFIRVFQRQTGLSPHAYLNQVRLRKARQLLRQGRTIAYTAYETGFADQSHFSRHFKRTMGFTPGQYSNFVQDS